MSILINELQGFQTIPCNLIEQDAMSVEARFLYCIMAVKPNEWVFYRAPLMKQMHIEDTRTFKKYMQELIDSGWVTSEGQERNADGTYGPKQYTIKADVSTEVQKMQPRCKNCRTAKNAPHNNNTLNKITTHNSACACACEDFYAALMESESAVEALCMKFSLTKENLQKKVEEFELHCKAGGVEHADVKDCQRHFRDWLNYNVIGDKNNGTTTSRDAMRQADADRRREECAAAIQAVLNGAGKVEKPRGLA